MAKKTSATATTIFSYLMDDLNHLKNNGLAILGERNRLPESTIIVVGVARGGTSLCSNVLAKLGIFMGDNSEGPTYEDINLSRAIEHQDFEKATKIISYYNSRYSMWGFKSTATIDLAEKLNSLLRNPLYIIIFKDILSISVRNKISMNIDIIDTLEKTAYQYNEIISFIKKIEPTALLVSYEKALNDKQRFVENVVSFINLNNAVSSDKIRKVTQNLALSQTEYLINSNAIEYYGYLDVVKSNFISGWAAFNQSERIVELDIYVNNEKITTIAATSLRIDVKEKNLHPTGHCGFELSLSTLYKAKVGDSIAVKISCTNQNLGNSPTII